MNAEAKVADFGCAKMMNTLRSVLTTRAGTLAFSSPETFNGKYSEASDVYAFGIMCFEVVTRQVPWQELAEPEIIKCVTQSFDEEAPVVKRLQGFGVSIEQQKQEWIQGHPLNNRRPDLTLAEDGCPDALQDLIQESWADDAEGRPTFVHCYDVLEGVEVVRVIDSLTN